MRKKLVHVHCLQFGLSGEYKMCWLAQGEVFGFALGDFLFELSEIHFVVLILLMSGMRAFTSSGL